MRIPRALLAALATLAVLASASPLPGAAALPSPTAINPPFALPLLEGPQVKVEVGHGGPEGDATSYAGLQPAQANFSVWFWDTGAPTLARLVLNSVNYAMAAAPTGDGDPTNGTLYVAKVPVETLPQGDQAYHFDFNGPSGAARLPPTGEFGQLRLDRADRFQTNAMMLLGDQTNFTYRTTSGFTMREVVNRTMVSVDPQLATHWDPVEGYTYSDHNRYIISPSAATSTNKEAFVGPTGASRVRFGDTQAFTNNSQPAIKHAVLLRGALLATGLFNESEIQIATEEMVVNITTYLHPFLRVRLNDGSEMPGDGPVDGDGWMDVDIWGVGMSTPVAFGSHFGEDFDTQDDALWDGMVGWPPQSDTNTDMVLAPYAAVDTVRAPDGSMIDFLMWESVVSAAATEPLIFGSYWAEEPMLFDGLASRQSAGVDLTYEWQIENTVWSGLGPIWTQDIPGIGLFAVTLTVRDPFGAQDSVTMPFSMRGRTHLVQPISAITFPEDGKRQVDLRVHFGDADGFETVQFQFAIDPPGPVEVERFPSNSNTINITAEPNWCGQVQVTISATDGVSPVVSQTFNVTVTCINDDPEVAGLPGIITFEEDTTYSLGPMGNHAKDDDGDTLVWSFYGSTQVSGVYDSGTDFLVFSAPADWNGLTNGTISVTDGTQTIVRDVTVSVTRANDAPTTIGIPVFTVLEDAANQTFALTEYFVDPDGDALTAQVTPYPGVEAGFSAVLRQVWFHPARDFVGATSFDLVASDGAGASVSVTVSLTVQPVNDPPSVGRAEPDGYVSADEGDTLDFKLEARDPDDSTLTYSFTLDGVPQGQNFDGTFSWTPPYNAAGPHEVAAAACDAAGACVSHTWQVLLADKNRAPTASIRRPAEPTFAPGEFINFSAVAEDEDGDPLTFTWSFGGLLQPKAGENVSVRFNSAGVYAIKLTVSDGALSTVVTTEVNVVYDLPPPPSNGTNGNGTPAQPSPGLEGPLALSGVATIVALFALWSRRRR
jgi:hypothetical protein